LTGRRGRKETQRTQKKTKNKRDKKEKKKNSEKKTGANADLIFYRPVSLSIVHFFVFLLVFLFCVLCVTFAPSASCPRPPPQFSAVQPTT
jgi:hypothetical protein